MRYFSDGAMIVRVHWDGPISKPGPPFYKARAEVWQWRSKFWREIEDVASRILFTGDWDYLADEAEALALIAEGIAKWEPRTEADDGHGVRR